MAGEQKSVAAEIAAMQQLGKKQRDMGANAITQTDALRAAMMKSTTLEEKRNDLIKKGDLELAAKMRHRITQNQEILDSNSSLMDMILKETQIRDDAFDEAIQMDKDRTEALKDQSKQLLVLGDEQTALGKITRSLDDKFNTLKDSSGLLEITVPSRTLGLGHLGFRRTVIEPKRVHHRDPRNRAELKEPIQALSLLTHRSIDLRE